ncbi:hypothetical protein ACP70R_047849 [Stipagrostis hirtigluma subsp. patula]
MNFPDFSAYWGTAVVGSTLYFLMDKGNKIIKFELGTQEVSLIQGPPASFYRWPIVLMTTEDGILLFLSKNTSRLVGILRFLKRNGFENPYQTGPKSGLHLWSREIGPDRDARWAPSRVIAPEALLPFNTLSRSPAVKGFADGVRVLFLWADGGLFLFDLKSGQARKVCGDRQIKTMTDYVVPYMSFYTPAHCE